MIFVFILFIFFLVLAFFDFPSLRTHFWPFTDVVRKIQREVTRKMQKTLEPRIPRVRTEVGLSRVIPNKEPPCRRMVTV